MCVCEQGSEQVRGGVSEYVYVWMSEYICVHESIRSK